MIIQPKTIGGIKSLAKKIKRERDCTHTAALNIAARQAGFENYQHAIKTLGDEA